MLDDIIDFAAGLGGAVVDLGEDICLGVQRTGEGLGSDGTDRMAEIGEENQLLGSLLYDALASTASAATSPLGQLVRVVMTQYYDALPSDLVIAMARKAGPIAAAQGARIATKQAAKRLLIRTVVPLVASRIAQSAAYRALARRLGVSAGASASGVGTLVGLLAFQGLAQRSSRASQNLHRTLPGLRAELRRQGGLDLIYFLVEGPLAKYLSVISAARMQTVELTRSANRILEAESAR